MKALVTRYIFEERKRGIDGKEMALKTLRESNKLLNEFADETWFKEERPEVRISRDGPDVGEC